MLARIIIYCLSILGIFSLGLVAFLNNRRNRVNVLFFMLTSATVVWLSLLFAADVTTTDTMAKIFMRVSFMFGNMIPVFFILFAYSFALSVKPNRLLMAAVGVLFITLTALGFTGFVFDDVVATSSGAVIRGAGLGYTLINLYTVAGIIVGLIILAKKRHRVNPVQRSQVKFLIYGTSITLTLSLIANYFATLLEINVLSAILGPISFLILTSIFGYAIIQHKLFDIRAVVARSAAYVLTVALIGGVYGFVAFRIINIFLSNTSMVFQQSVYTILAVVLAFTFQPIRRFFERVSNFVFYRERYNSQALVTEIGRILSSEIQLDLLSKRVLQEVITKMKIDRAELVVFGKDELFFLGSDHGKKLMIGDEVVNPGHNQIVKKDLQKLGRLIVVADELSGGEKKEVLQKYGISVSLALRTSEEFLGYLLFSEKKSGDIYSDEDIRTLKIIANELSVGLQNAKAFAEIQQFNITLQDKVNQATRKLRNANDQLKELDKAKDEFISMASHQLRTPLTTIKGYVSMLDEGDFGKLTREQKKYIEQALDGSNRMARLIDDLLNVSRMEAGKFFIDAQKLDLNKIVPQELEQLKNLADSKGVDLRYVKPKKAVPIMNLDENKTRQVIMNLADNAVHYSAPPKGGGKVEVRLEQDGENIVYVVRDNGIGVPRDQQGKLFTKMFRAKNAQEVRPDGTGLGLYLVKRVVEDQGGKLIFESTPGKGSVFGFKIPVHNKIVVDKKAQKALLEAHKNG